MQQGARSKDDSIHVTDEMINTVTHLTAACLALLGGALLIIEAALLADPWKIIGMSIYGCSLLCLFVFSTLHHGVNGNKSRNQVLRTFDYVSVFLLITGTVTPLVIVVYRNAFGWAVLGSVWAIAVTGIVLRTVYPKLPRYITNTFYIVLGWLSVALIGDIPHLPIYALVLLASGGLVYSIGFSVYVFEKPNMKPGRFGFHELWHCLVIVAAAFHYSLMYTYVLHY